MVERFAYFDTSVIAPLYRAEPLTAIAEMLQERWRPVVSPLTEVELASMVARWERTGELDDEQANLVNQAFADDLRLNAFERSDLGERHYWQARAWLQKRTTNLRTLDALHLAVAVENDWPMVTADRQLHEAATSLGFQSHLAQETGVV